LYQSLFAFNIIIIFERKNKVKEGEIFPVTFEDDLKKIRFSGTDLA